MSTTDWPHITHHVLVRDPSLPDMPHPMRWPDIRALPDYYLTAGMRLLSDGRVLLADDNPFRRSKSNRLILPGLYLLRHSIELAMKVSLWAVTGIKPPHIHDLSKLWDKLKTEASACGMLDHEDDEYLQAQADRLVCEWQSLDANSTSLRYNNDKAQYYLHVLTARVDPDKVDTASKALVRYVLSIGDESLRQREEVEF